MVCIISFIIISRYIKKIFLRNKIVSIITRYIYQVLVRVPGCNTSARRNGGRLQSGVPVIYAFRYTEINYIVQAKLYNLSALCGLLLWPLVTVMVAPLIALPGLVWKLPLSCHWLVPSVFVDTGNRRNLFLHTSPCPNSP